MKYHKFITAFLFVSLGFYYCSYGQNYGYQINKIIPPSPTSAALGKYGEIPVSFYNGTPNISIPIYDISTINHNLKIALNYDASGIRVAQDASWVGLGWSLSAGGVITRTVRQKDDFKEQGYYRAVALPSPSSNNDPAAKTYFNSAYEGVIDLEPDIYSYNFNGISGRFVLGKKSDGAPIFLDEKNSLKIVYNDTNGKWTITTDEGYKYTFGTTETTQEYSGHGGTEVVNNAGVQGLNADLDADATTAWYLDKIEAPAGEAIDFVYVKGKSLSLLNRSETYFKLNSILTSGCLTELPGFSHIYQASRQAITEVYLKTITFATGSVEFNTSARTDVEYLDNYPNLITPSKLDNIVIKTFNGQQLKKYLLTYSYFNSGEENNFEKRLKLDAVTEYGSDNAAKSPYLFTYRNPNSLPSKKSKKIDHWGFYNNINNSSLLPANIITQTVSFDPANRDPDETQVYPADGILTTVKYPTGGSTSFEYELHDYSNLHGEMLNRILTKGCDVASHPLHPEYPSIRTFTIPSDAIKDDNGNVPIMKICGYNKFNNSASDMSANLGYANLRKVNSDGSKTAVGSCTTPGQEITYLALPPGNYEMDVLANQNWTFSMSISWKEKEIVPLEKRIGGGIRVRKITNDDGLGHTTVKRYLYTDYNNKSTGVLISYPKYSSTYNTPFVTALYNPGFGFPNNEVCTYSGNYTMVSSSTLYPSALSSKSGTVAYSKVTELIGANGEGGKTEYYFNNSEELLDDFVGVPAATNPLNGSLYTINYFDAQNILVKKDQYQYTIKETTTLRAVKLFSNLTFSDPPTGFNNYNYFVKFYDINSYWKVNSQKSETIYSGTVGYTTTTDYIYDSNVHRAPTQSLFTKSDGSLLMTEYKRASDYPPNQGTVVNQMASDNVISPIIEEKTFLNQGTSSKQISGIFNEYQRYNNKFYKPYKVYRYEGTPPYNNPTQPNGWFDGLVYVDPSYRLILTNDLYDLTSGNLLTRHYTNAPYETFVWGYNSQYPVARLIGVDYNSIAPLFNSAMLNNLSATSSQILTELNSLRTAVSGEKKEIATYSYLPLVGMTSSSDAKALTTHYEYDNFQRLKSVKDKEGNIVKHLKYNYRP